MIGLLIERNRMRRVVAWLVKTAGVYWSLLARDMVTVLVVQYRRNLLEVLIQRVSVDEYYRSYGPRVGYYVLSLFIELISSVRVCGAQEFVCHGLHTLYVFITILPSVVEEEVGE